MALFGVKKSHIEFDHIHLLVYDQTGKNVIPESIQFLAGRVAQDYNDRNYVRTFQPITSFLMPKRAI
jgi:hypothetical protein